MNDREPRREAARLISTRPWFALATVEPDGAPTLSYIPFVFVDGTFGMVASRLAAHTPNLLAGRSAAIILIDDVEHGDSYAQARLSVDVSPLARPRGSAHAEAIWSALAARHGQTVQILRTLPDFEAIALRPVGARLVLGFAAAHDLDAETIAAGMRALKNERR
jgi:putative heme iron utilization protein